VNLSTLDELIRFKNRRALPTWDATLSALLDAADDSWEESEETSRLKLETAHLDQARKVADAVLYEGYLLLTRTTSRRRRISQVPVRRADASRLPGRRPVEPSASHTECLVECADGRPGAGQRQVPAAAAQAGASAAARFLARPARLPRSPLTAPEYTSWDEAIEREQQVSAEVNELLTDELGLTVHIEPGESTEDIVVDSTGRVADAWSGPGPPSKGDQAPRPNDRRTLRCPQARCQDREPGLSDVRLSTREDGLTHALIAAHALIWIPGGKFLSRNEPPEGAVPAVAECQNIGTWPVLAGPQECQDLILSSPVILYDHAEVAPESAGDLFDATEIDEILTLRTLALTDGEARGKGDRSQGSRADGPP